jgi:methionyl-tRNA formyltransferase
MTKKINFAFFGSSNFSIYCLKEIIKKYIPSLVITLEAKPQGRGLKLKPNPVFIFAIENKLPVIDLKNWSLIENELFDFGLIASFGKIIPNFIIKNFKKGILNIHPSLLPKYRGVNPIREAIFNGDKETGVTLFLIDEMIDHGPIISQEKIILNFKETFLDLEKNLAILGGRLFNNTIENFLSGNINFKIQDENLATYTRKTKKEDGLLSVYDPYIIWDRKIRALNPWPGTWLEIFLKDDLKNLKIFKIEKMNEKDVKINLNKVKIGDFFREKNELGLKISDAYILIKELQLQDRKRMSSKEFLNGYKIEYMRVRL